jgi:hypothetical protein
MKIYYMTFNVRSILIFESESNEREIENETMRIESDSDSEHLGMSEKY